MSGKFASVNYNFSPGAANQNPENRSTDPTPLKTPDGLIGEETKKSIGWMPMIVRSLGSGFTYTIANYGIHKIMKPKGKDPSAVKQMKAGSIIKGGGVQAVASAASSLTSMAVKGLIPATVAHYTPNIISQNISMRPVLTGTYKVLGSMFVSGRPSFWNGVTDFATSAISDAGVSWAMPTY